MQSLKNIVINGAMILALLFGLTVSATAAIPSFEEVKAQAEQGDARAQSVLGSRYDLGVNGVSKDDAKAFYWHKKAAEQGDAVSQSSIGFAYGQGKGIRQDYSKAFYWHKKAADKNNYFSQFGLGTMYQLGRGVRQNYATAKEWYGKSCDNGVQYGCDNYRILNEQGY